MVTDWIFAQELVGATNIFAATTHRLVFGALVGMGVDEYEGPARRAAVHQGTAPLTEHQVYCSHETRPKLTHIPRSSLQ